MYFQTGIWLCSEPSTATPVAGNPNEKIMEKLRVNSKQVFESPFYPMIFLGNVENIFNH